MAKKRCSIVKATAQYAVYNTRDHYCILGRPCISGCSLLVRRLCEGKEFGREPAPEINQCTSSAYTGTCIHGSETILGHWAACQLCSPKPGSPSDLIVCLTSKLATLVRVGYACRLMVCFVVPAACSEDEGCDVITWPWTLIHEALANCSAPGCQLVTHSNHLEKHAQKDLKPEVTAKQEAETNTSIP